MSRSQNSQFLLLLIQVSYLIVDEADEDLEMAEDPFMEAGIPELPEYLNEVPSSINNKIIREDSIKIAISKASELPIEIGKVSENKAEGKDTKEIKSNTG